MSNLYHLEPQAEGLISFKTNFGDLDIELFVKQCPKNSRNFVQLCLDGFYEETIFERVEKDFIAIGGARDGEEDEDEEKLPDEFHSRLKFTRRGLLATANTAKNSNGSKFFFTLGPAPELQNKNTIFGRVVGNSVYTLVTLNECSVDDDLKPYSDKVIEQVIVKENPFPDLKSRKYARKAAKHANDAAEDDYDPLAKPKPSKQLAQKLSLNPYSDDSDDSDNDDDDGKNLNESHNKSEQEPEKFQDARDESPKKRQHSPESETVDKKSAIGDRSPENAEGISEKEKKLREIRAQIASIKQQIENEPGVRRRAEPHASVDRVESKKILPEVPETESHPIKLNIAPKRSKNREIDTMERVQSFKKRLKQTDSQPSMITQSKSAAELTVDDIDDDELEALDKVDGDDWMRHKFEAELDTVVAKDANLRGKEWYSIEDPRNALSEASRGSHSNNRRSEDNRSSRKHRDRSK